MGHTTLLALAATLLLAEAVSGRDCHRNRKRPYPHPRPPRLPTIEEVVSSLGLQSHPEGGYFSETYRAEEVVDTNRTGSTRNAGTSIYYMLTDKAPISTWAINLSDIVHSYHGGRALTYYVLHKNGTLETQRLGMDILAGERPQFVVKGGCWKATEIESPRSGEWGLLGEAVAPGWDFRDFAMGSEADLVQEFPQHEQLIRRLAFH
eukprot:TRINITY_DN10451_c0_g1_i1.p2 TRINITY_DN10451_c0_g1~~TRINITY_DN10451_c0_g1_i1.p2  ORF type:complete len:238 (+),score=65.99 TRINITY_DN10451_c0_g1_i1:98-715(+)